MLLVLAYTVFTRTQAAEPNVELHPFWSYTVWEKEKQQVLLNILMFVPVGLLAGAWIGKKSVLFGMGFSALIELAQFIGRRGLCEFDDVFHNTLGALLGFCLFWILKQTKEILRRRRR